MGKLFTRRAKLGKTVEAAGRTLIGKHGKDLFFGDHSPRANVISKIKRFHLVFRFNFAPLRFVFFKSLSSVISKGKKGLPLNSWWEFKFPYVQAGQNKRAGGQDLTLGP